MSEHEFILLEKDHSVRQQQRSRFLYRLLIIGLGFVLLFIILTIIIGNSSPQITSPKYAPKSIDCSVDYSFDYFLLVLRWPPTICDSKQCAKHDNKWLIHGRWPTKNDNTWPEYCCFDRQFNPKQLQPIVNLLLSDWTNLEENKSYDSLWAHEWSRHGTCTQTHQIDYFNRTLSLSRDLPIGQWFQEYNIKPSNDLMYNLSRFEEVFNAKLKSRVQIHCDKQKGKEVLTDIRICLNNTDSMEPIDCKDKSSSCNNNFFYLKADS